MRRLLIIAAGVLILTGLAIGAYYLFFAKEAGIEVGLPTNPFDGTGADTAGNGEPPPEVGTEIAGAGEEVAPNFFKITSGPVARGAVGFSIFFDHDGSTTTPPVRDLEIRYIDRASGNMYRYQADARISERLTNRTLPGIQETSWVADGSRTFLRYLNTDGTDVSTYSLPATGVDGYSLESGLSELITVGTSSIISVLPSTGGSIATIARPDGTNPRTLFSSNLSALRVYAANNSYFAATKPSAGLAGYGFSINSATGAFTRMLGPLAGLTILPSPSGALVFHTSVSGNTVRAGVVDTSTLVDTSLPVSTFSDKCVWTRDSRTLYCAVPRALSGTLPDAWYQGVLNTSDRIWKIDLTSRVASLILDPLAVAEVDIDVDSIVIGDQNDALIFTNKQDGSLWLLKL